MFRACTLFSTESLNNLSVSAPTIITARLAPQLFPFQLVRTSSRTLIVTILVFLTLAGFGFRAFHLDAEGLSEDELNKVRTVEAYRAHGLSSANGEHPFLMKALMTVSIVSADFWNDSLATQHPALRVSTETAARLPCVLLGALSSILIFMVASELFGVEIGLVAAALWAFDPTAIGFNRIAKEDTFVVFFFLLANVFWLRGQRAAEEGRLKPDIYYWATAITFGAMLASKYLPHYIAISTSYYHIFQRVKLARWRLGKLKWILFFVVMGMAFVVLNPTILLPGTWHEMKMFAGEKRLGHDGFEFMGQLYRNQFTQWLDGVPWYFYYVFMGIKLPVPALLAFVAGLPFVFLKRLGDGRFFIIFWLFYWFFPFTVLGGKFTRYFTFALPVVLIVAAIGISELGRLLRRLLNSFSISESGANYARAALAVLILTFSAYASTLASPHFRLYTNVLGGGQERAGSYFPHDDFYDASVRETAAYIASHARPDAHVASETPELFTYYARVANRSDLIYVSLSDHAALGALKSGDVIVIARGRRYFSNDALTRALTEESQPAANIALGDVPSTSVYFVNDKIIELLAGVDQ